ncbi:sensor histidine kinase [Nocardia salmonicida]|uniref:sensor histidine kinase n=1 Tax=Nocardia salmonicida TaxID=53431 RepID=UPI002E286331|nr:nitrate- and nitrite sensing domain-containing protein [Nocardia salmonicida]
MNIRRTGVRGRVSVRIRLLSMVLISSVMLLVVGGGGAVYLVNSARDSTEWAELASSTTAPAILMVSAFQEERRLSLLRLAGDASSAPALVTAKQRSDEALAAVMAKGDAARALNPDGSREDIEGYNKLFAMVPVVRNGVEATRIPPEEVFALYTGVISTIIAASMLAARVAPEAKVGIELGYAVDQLRAAEALSQADTLGSVALTTGKMSSAEVVDFGRRVGEFRGEAAYSAAVLKGRRLAQLSEITASPQWQRVIAMQDALLLRGPVSAKDPETELPVSLAEWQDASKFVGLALQKLWEDQSGDAHVIARQQGERDSDSALLGGALIALAAVAAFLIALVMANRFIARMHRLRHDTLELADERLPEVMRKVEAGETVDTSTEGSQLDFGTDELGQVAAAFNRAHVAAMSAAVAEAQTKAGISTVFLDIAHRSQVVVHRQLSLLDRAERDENNADQLDLLFQLDHLATRARRNAENLIILGGEQPGRRWRNPVPLIDLVRGAIAESLDYTRIAAKQMPQVKISGHAVADVIHLLAELMDNATAFSPPESQVSVSGIVVGRGVAVEITDQGLGMPEADLAQRNAMLADPPAFSVGTLAGTSRLGLFVVATLAGRHGISVRMSESVYGGVRVVVLIPTALAEASDPESAISGQFPAVSPRP